MRHRSQQPQEIDVDATHRKYSAIVNQTLFPDEHPAEHTS